MELQGPLSRYSFWPGHQDPQQVSTTWRPRQLPADTQPEYLDEYPESQPTRNFKLLTAITVIPAITVIAAAVIAMIIFYAVMHWKCWKLLYWIFVFWKYYCLLYSIIVFSTVLLSFESIIVLSTVLLYCTYYYASLSEIHFCISKTVLIGDLVNRKICEALESKAGGGL